MEGSRFLLGSCNTTLRVFMNHMTPAAHPLTPLVGLLSGLSRGAVREDHWQLEERTAGVHGTRVTPTQPMSPALVAVAVVVVVAH